MISYCTERGWTVKGCILTHYHVDHAGGKPPPPFDAFGIKVQGVVEVVAKGLPVYCHEDDIDKLVAGTGISRDSVTAVQDNHILKVGQLEVKCIHAPGHTRGSIILVCESEDLVISGDVIFPGSCGKLEEDWPEACSCMHKSLMNLGNVLQDQYCIYPGHKYGPSKSTVGEEKKTGMLKPRTLEEFTAMMGPKPGL